jgi:predicted O-methyltransferase YrrM
MLIFKKIGSSKLNFSRNLLFKIGIFPIIDHYYEPQFNFENLKKELDEKRNLPGINFDITQQLFLLEKINYKEELLNLNLEIGSPNTNFKIDNNFFERGDAEIYYSMIRYYKPKKIIEIGSGFSTLIALEANKKNNSNSTITCIEPYENSWLEKLDINLIRKKIEQIDFKNEINLESNDILFIDSSHIIRPEGDVLKIFHEILPILNKGVIIHVHDIFTPFNYPSAWIKKENRFWNEQYLLESLLDNSKRYSVLCSLNYLKNEKYNELSKICPYLKKNSMPGSFYIKIN